MEIENTAVPLTFGSGPSDPLRLGDEPGTWVQVVIDAPIDVVFALVTDISLPARFSEEFLGAHWADAGTSAEDATGTTGTADVPSVGAMFIGRSQHQALGEWEAPSFVEFYEPDKTFGWATVDATNPGSRWRYDLMLEDTGTRLRYSMSLGPGPSGLSIAIEAMPEKEPRILRRRIGEHHANMLRTIEGIRAIAEDRA